MPTDDLSSIPGLEGKYREALAKKQVTDLRSLARADSDVLYRALASFRPRPDREQVSRWQDVARTRLEEVTDPSDWHQAASFAVMFMQRQAGDGWERRIDVEQTEQEPERPTRSWPGWDGEPVCRWMRDQLPAAESARPEPAAGAGDEHAHAADEPAAMAEKPAGVGAAGRPPLRIDHAAVIDANGRADLVVAGELAASPPAELVAPVRVVLTVSRARRGTEVMAVARVLRSGDVRGWNPQDPVAVPPSGEAEFDLSRVAPGRHDVALIAWAPDATAEPASVRLPVLTVRPGAG